MEVNDTQQQDIDCDASFVSCDGNSGHVLAGFRNAEVE